MSSYQMTVPLGGQDHDVSYEVTHEGCGPSGYAFDSSGDAGEPMEFHVVTVGDAKASDVPPHLLEAIEDYIDEHHEPDDGDPDWYGDEP